ncbi:hypothetical protein AH06_214 [Erwinia phage AH06]|nr:hypothetical protein AH06_214 [Erwinia phage AH06]
MGKQKEESIVDMMVLAQRLNNLVVGMQVRKAQMMSGAARVVDDSISKARAASGPLLGDSKR